MEMETSNFPKSWIDNDQSGLKQLSGVKLNDVRYLNGRSSLVL